MSITDELRKWAKDNTLQDMVLTTYPPQHAVRGVLETLLRIADRIDAEHEDAVRKKAARMLTKTSEYMNDNDLAEIGLVRLPVDADGEYIHEHDKVDWRDHAGTWHENATVVAVCDDGCYVMHGIVFHVHKSDIRHHHIPTVEDVLLDACRAYHSLMVESMSDVAHDMPAPSEIIAEYAKRLKLAGDEE